MKGFKKTFSFRTCPIGLSVYWGVCHKDGRDSTVTFMGKAGCT